MTGDLNTTFGHRHYVYSAALLFYDAPPLNLEPINKRRNINGN